MHNHVQPAASRRTQLADPITMNVSYTTGRDATLDEKQRQEILTYLDVITERDEQRGHLDDN